MKRRFTRLGLLAEPEADSRTVTLGQWLDEYLALRTDVKPLTTRILADSAKRLRRFFGDRKLLNRITPGDADDYRRHLARKLGPNTVRRLCGRAKQYFRAALRKRLIRENSFGDMGDCAVKANRTRDAFIGRDTIGRILGACPNNQWRLIVVLTRYGGLRCPSELLAQQWGDVDWDRNRMTVRSPKTEHPQGHDCRVVPIFPEVRPILEEAYDAAPEETSWIITRYRDATQNLRTHFRGIIAQTGESPWPKLFQDLRASRATELAADYPAHVAAG